MTTNTFPAGPDRRLLHADNPSELLAETRICLRQIPSDCVIMMGHCGHGSPPMVTISHLADLLAHDGRDHLEHHLGLMLRRGSTRAYALIVLGDGYEEIPEQLVEDVTVITAGRLLLTTSQLLPEPFPLDALWVAGNGSCRQVILGERDREREEERILISPPHPLQPFAETTAAASEVLTGRPIPQAPKEEPELTQIGRSLALSRTELSDPLDPGELFADARTALRRLRTPPRDPADPGFVTDCEHVAALLSAVAVDRLHWELLAQCVDRGNSGRIDRDELLQVLARDGKWAPDPDVCAGGSWYEAIGRLRIVAAVAVPELPPQQRGIAREAWRGLTAMLVLLSWWNHRFATAGGLVDELRDREPESTLAPLLARMTDTPIFPAWWPSS